MWVGIILGGLLAHVCRWFAQWCPFNIRSKTTWIGIILGGLIAHVCRWFVQWYLLKMQLETVYMYRSGKPSL